VLAGAGIVPGSVARDTRLIDVAPTVAALLGLPAPGHAEGRALVEVLALEPAAAAHRAAADNTRASAIEVVTDVHADAPSIVWLAAVLAGLATIVVLGRRHLHVSSLAGAIGFAVMLVAIVLITRGRLSPSYIPSLARTEQLGAIGIAAALVLQVATSWFVVGRARDRLACGNALAVVSLAIGLGSVGLVHAWFAPPFLDVPPPLWMVAIPTLDLAAATCAAGAILTLAFAAIRSR
jgi:hypothetical protein